MTEVSVAPSQPAAPPIAPEPLRRNLIVGAMLISTFMAAVEITVISTAMPVIVARLGRFELFSWVFSIYLLAQAVMTPVYGKLADVYGRKSVYLASTVLFLFGSLLCGFAWSMPAMVAFRAIQGLGGAGLVPLGTIILADVTTTEERPRFFGYVSAVWGVAAIAGPLLGSFIVTGLSWPFVFWINIPIGLLTILLVGRYREVRVRSGGRVGLISAALLTIGIGAVMVAIVQYQAVGPRGALALVAIGIAALALLARHERHMAEPLLPMGLWRNPIVVTANASALLCGALLICATAFLPTYVEGVAGGDTLAAGVTVGVMTVSWTVASMGLSRIIGRLPGRAVLVVGSLALLAGSVGLLGGIAGAGTGVIGVSCVLIGAGLGVNSLLFVIAIQANVAGPDRGRATALFYFFRLFGQALGAAVFGGVMNAALFGAGAGERDVVRDLVEPARRSGLAPADLQHWVGVLDGGLWEVFWLGAILAAAVVVVSVVVPKTFAAGRS